MSSCLFSFEVRGRGGFIWPVKSAAGQGYRPRRQSGRRLREWELSHIVSVANSLYLSLKPRPGTEMCLHGQYIHFSTGKPAGKPLFWSL